MSEGMLAFTDHGARRAPMPLPNSASICLTIDIAFEAFEEACQHRGRPTPKGTRDPYSLSFAEYGLRVGIWRLTDLLSEFSLRAGIMASGLAAQRYPQTLRAIAEAGHEIIAHGWTNDSGIPTDDDETELESVCRTASVIKAATGVGSRGWVSPGYAGTDALRRALVSHEFIYTCDDAADDLPYVVEVNSRPLVVMPRTNFGSNDLGTWFGAKQTPASFLSSVRSQFDSIYAEACMGRPGWMELVLHAQFAGRLQCATELKQMLEYMLSHEGLWCATRSEFAQWCLKRPEFRI
jgi:allantoinase